MKESDSLPTLLMGEDAGTEFQEIEKQDVVQVKATSHLLIENMLLHIPLHIPSVVWLMILCKLLCCRSSH
jgi:hypothetical protein